MKRLLLACLIPLGLTACTVTEPEDPNERLGYQVPRSSAEEAANFEIPTVTPLENGNIVVRFKKTGCSVLFDPSGNLLEGGRHCDDVDLHRARQAVRAHIAGRGATDFLNS